MVITCVSVRWKLLQSLTESFKALLLLSIILYKMFHFIEIEARGRSTTRRVSRSNWDDGNNEYPLITTIINRIL